MRSMQILRDRLLILSFYRTASALNVFDLAAILRSPGKDNQKAEKEEKEEGKGEEDERVLKLPAGVIAFQSIYDDLNSQKLVH